MSTKPTDIKSRPKCNKLLSLFPSSTRSKAALLQPLPSSSSTSTMDTDSSSSKSTLITTVSKRQFQVRDPSFIPTYSHLRNVFKKFQSKFKQRTMLLRSQLIPWLQKNKFDVHIKESIEWGMDGYSFWGLKNSNKEAKELQNGRSSLLRWWRSLLTNVHAVKSDDKIFYYECILEIISRPEFLEFDYLVPADYDEFFQLKNFPQQNLTDEYRYLLVNTLKFAIDKLNLTTIHSNLISFCSKIIAICYFKIPCLSSSLLKVLSIRPTTMKNLYREIKSCESNEADCIDNLKIVLPPFLHNLMVSDRASYMNAFSSESHLTSFPFTMTGNWVRRLQSDDSELFFSFYNHYHHVLKTYLSTYFQESHHDILTRSPGYMYLASYFSDKIESLIQLQVQSVTHVSVVQSNASIFTETCVSFTPSHDQPKQVDTPPQTVSQSGKPFQLIRVSSLYAKCLARCVAGPSDLFVPMLNVWVRAAIKKTQLNESQQVYCLIDFIDLVILEIQSSTGYFLDISYITHMLGIILSKSDHSITLVRTLAFIYHQFNFLTNECCHLYDLCIGIMLTPPVFERLLLHWSKNVRTVFLRCLTWRVGRVWQQASVRWNSEADQMMKMLVPDIPYFKACDGQSCWLKWQSDYQNTNNKAETDLAIKLHIHIVLESLLASFHNNYAETRQVHDSLKTHNRRDISCIMAQGDKRQMVSSCDSSHSTQSHLVTKSKTSKDDNVDTTVSSLKLSDHTSTHKVSVNYQKTLGQSCTLPIFNIVQDSLCKSMGDTVTHLASLKTQHIPPPPSVSDSARQWKYKPSNHIYATKVLCEIKAIAHEYCMWLRKDKDTIVKTAMLLVPSLNSNWPKNWSSSHG